MSITLVHIKTPEFEATALSLYDLPGGAVAEVVDLMEQSEMPGPELLIKTRALLLLALGVEDAEKFENLSFHDMVAVISSWVDGGSTPVVGSDGKDTGLRKLGLGKDGTYEFTMENFIASGMPDGDGK